MKELQRMPPLLELGPGIEPERGLAHPP